MPSNRPAQHTTGELARALQDVSGSDAFQQCVGDRKCDEIAGGQAHIVLIG